MPVIRFTSQLNGYTALCLTKTDILDKLDEVKIGVAYVKVTYLTHFCIALAKPCYTIARSNTIAKYKIP